MTTRVTFAARNSLAVLCGVAAGALLSLPGCEFNRTVPSPTEAAPAPPPGAVPPAGAQELPAPAAGAPAGDVAIRRGREWLEDQQRRAYEALGSIPPSHGPEAEEAQQRAADEKLLAALSKVPGADIPALRRKLEDAREAARGNPVPRYEDPATYQTILIIANQIANSVDDFQERSPRIPNLLPSLDRVTFGTLPGFVNAGKATVNPEATDGSQRAYVIFFETGFIPFADAFSTVIAGAVPEADPIPGAVGVSLNPDAIERHLDAHPEAVRDFEELLHSYLLQGGPSLASGYKTRDLEWPRAAFATLLYRGMLLFALAHELGHIPVDEGYPTGGPDPGLPGGWDKEIAADGWAITFSIMATGPRKTLETTVMAASAYFSTFDVVERGLSILATGQDGYRAKTTHPPAARRKERLPHHVTTALRRFWNLELESVEEFRKLGKASERLDAVVSALWKRTVPG